MNTQENIAVCHKACEDGQTALREGKARNTNPYPAGTKPAEFWDFGYNLAWQERA